MNLSRIYQKPTSKVGEYTYDKGAHRWILAPEYIQKVNPSLDYNTAVRKSRAYSQHVYFLMWNEYVATWNKSLVEWLISCTEEGKEKMLEMLREQAEADYQSNIDDIAYQSPLSEKGKTFQIKDMIKACVAPTIHGMLDSMVIAGFYINKAFDQGVRFNYSSYERWDY